MIFRRMIFFLLITLIVAGSCKKEKQFTIKGKIAHAGGDTIYLAELHVSTVKPLAKVKMNDKGEFSFKGSTSIPSFYLLKVSESNFITLLVDSVDQIYIEADVANFHKEYHIEGSLGSIQVKELNEALIRTEYKLDSLQGLNTLSEGNSDYELLKARWAQEYNKIIEDQNRYSVNFVLTNPFSMASVYALYQKYKDGSFVIKDLQTMRTAASALNAIYPNSTMVKALYENTLQYLREQKALEMKQFINEQGSNSPDIKLPNANNQTIALSSLRGKVVLLHFWAAEDQGSRSLNPLLVEAFNKYHSKGLEIYQVNVGSNRSEWLDAIDSDGLKWINVGDLKGCTDAQLTYNIKSIPYNYLLDREGVVVAKNLTGPSLDKALATLLN